MMRKTGKNKNEDLNPDPALILEKIRNFCSYRERSESEVLLKLRSLKMPAAKTRNAIILLREEGFINDERYARALVRGKWRVNRWGRIKITFELRAKKIPEKLIISAMDEIDPDEYRLVLRDLIDKKAKAFRIHKKAEINSGETLNLREKLFNFALGKGYEYDLVSEIIKELNI